MTVVFVHDTKRDEAFGKVDLNTTKRKTEKNKRAAARAAKDAARVKQHKEFVEQVYESVRRSGRR